MRPGFALVLLTACGSAPARTSGVANTAAGSKPPPASPVAPTDSYLFVSAVRPTLDVAFLVPDFHEELRWPLSAMSHPELEPQFPIARVFAEPGIGWLELCERGVQNRTSPRNRDELEYLRGWCSAIKGDVDAAIGKLAPLTMSAIAGLATAVRADMATIIANTRSLDDADRLLNKHKVRDAELYDQLAATYVELGRRRDAYEMNRRAMDLDERTGQPSVRCRRALKEVVLGGDRERSPLLAELELMGGMAAGPDATCVASFQAVKCWLGPAAECEAYFKANKIDTRNVHLLAAYQAWPSAGNYYDWASIVHQADEAGNLPGAFELGTIALDAAVRAAPQSCSDSFIEWLNWLAKGRSNERSAQVTMHLGAYRNRCKAD